MQDDIHNGQSPLEFDELELPSENDLAVLNALGSDQDAQDVSFQGIRRRLGLHQETLSRSLHRLQRDGYIEHLANAYRISPKGLETINLSGDTVRPKPNSREPIDTPILSAMLPANVDVRDLADALSYKWFGDLRWLGSSQSANSTTLTWITSDTAQKISVRITGNSLSIDTTERDSNYISRVIPSAYELFDQVWKSVKSLGKNSIPERYGKAS